MAAAAVINANANGPDDEFEPSDALLDFDAKNINFRKDVSLRSLQDATGLKVNVPFTVL